MPHPRRPRLLLLATTYLGNSLEFMQGLIAYSDQREPIDFLFEAQPENINPSILQRFPDADAFVLDIYDQKLIRVLIATGKPVVMMHASQSPRVAVVTCDDYGIGEVAFEHLHSLGLKHFAAFGIPKIPFSNRRLAGFRQAAQKAGAMVHLPPSKPPIYMDSESHLRLRAWLKELPKPTGLFCVMAYWALEVFRVCHEVGMLVPEELAVLAVDRDDLLCNMVTPKLSTIDTGAFRIGYEAAGLALQMLRGQPRPKKPLIIPPGEVIIRQSTDMLAIEDADLAVAVRYLRQNACQNIVTEDILDRVPLSRRALELKFKRIFGRTIRQEITRLRMVEAQRLLAGTNLGIMDVSLRSGFTSLSEFGKVFREKCGMTPHEYRKQNRGLPITPHS